MGAGGLSEARLRRMHAITDATPLGRTRRILTVVGPNITRYALVVVIVLNVLVKWTDGEAMTIQPLLAHSPFYGWLYRIGDIQTVSELFGVIELITAALLALRPLAPLLSFVGSAMAFVMFVSTISFLFTTPGVTMTLMGGFLLKDLVYLGVALWLGADSLDAIAARHIDRRTPSTPVS